MNARHSEVLLQCKTLDIKLGFHTESSRQVALKLSEVDSLTARTATLASDALTMAETARADSRALVDTLTNTSMIPSRNYSHLYLPHQMPILLLPVLRPTRICPAPMQPSLGTRTARNHLQSRLPHPRMAIACSVMSVPISVVNSRLTTPTPHMPLPTPTAPRTAQTARRTVPIHRVVFPPIRHAEHHMRSENMISTDLLAVVTIVMTMIVMMIPRTTMTRALANFRKVMIPTSHTATGKTGHTANGIMTHVAHFRAVEEVMVMMMVAAMVAMVSLHEQAPLALLASVQLSLRTSVMISYFGMRAI